MKLSFIIIEYHSLLEIRTSCASIRDFMSSELDYEIIISSNSTYSKGEQGKILAENQEGKWVFNARNGGFAYAMNEGLKVATGDVLIAMNPDVKIKAGLSEMINYLMSDSSIGLIAPRIVSRKGVVQDSYRDFITPIRFIKRHCIRLLHGEEKFDTNRILQVDWVIGAFMMMTRKSYEAVGGFDDGYFLYCEDMEPWKVQLSGKDCILAYSRIVSGRVSEGWQRSVCFCAGAQVRVKLGSSQDNLLAMPVFPPDK